MHLRNRQCIMCYKTHCSALCSVLVRCAICRLFLQGDKVRQQGIAAADELTASNDMLRGAVQALTREHNASCAAEATSQEQLCQLQSALEILQTQVVPCKSSFQKPFEISFGFLVCPPLSRLWKLLWHPNFRSPKSYQGMTRKVLWSCFARDIVYCGAPTGRQGTK